jgi:hypothetical protein
MSEPEDRHAAIRQRRAAITPPPWVASRNEGEYDLDGPIGPTVNDTSGVLRVGPIASCLEFADAEFIAHAPDDIDTLLREVEQLKEHLRGIEWAATNPLGEGACPACNAAENVDPHDPDCWLAAEIKPV